MELPVQTMIKPHLGHLGRLLQLARRQLYCEFDIATPPDERLPNEELMMFERVAVTLRVRGRLRALASGSGSTLSEAVIDAVRRAVRDERHGPPLLYHEVDIVVIELLVQLSSSPIDNRTLKSVEQAIRPGHDGIELQVGKHQVWYPPIVSVDDGLTSHLALLHRLCRMASLPPDGWSRPDVTLYRTDWVLLAEAFNDQGFIELSHARRQEQARVTPGGIERSILRAANRLLNSQRADGSFLANYDALNDRSAEEPPTMTDVAGATYALARAASLMKQPEYRACLERGTERAVRYLLDHSWAGSRMLRRPSPTAPAPGQQGTSEQAGATALTLLALQFNHSAYIWERRVLTEKLLSLQAADGSFAGRGIEARVGQEGQQGSTPGQVLVALLREWEATRDPRLIDSVRRAYPSCQQQFRSESSVTSVLWQVDAWRMIVERAVDPFFAREPLPLHAEELERYAAFVFEQADWLLTFARERQQVRCDHLSFPLPDYRAAACLEALVRACGLAHLLGERERVEPYRRAAFDALAFLDRLQVGAEEAYLFPTPNLAVGGIPRELNLFIFHSQQDQQALTAWAAALETPSLFL